MLDREMIGQRMRQHYQEVWAGDDPWSFDSSPFEQARYAHQLSMISDRHYPQALEIAVSSPTTPHKKLRRLCWLLADPLAITKTPWNYQRYIQNSSGEFSVAKHDYVVSQSGWFSERSAAYLASGRPVITQDTGFSLWLPSGRGLFAFSSLEQAASAIEAVESNYMRHCDAARELVTEFFDYTPRASIDLQ